MGKGKGEAEDNDEGDAKSWSRLPNLAHLKPPRRESSGEIYRLSYSHF